jgi:hypothetical protein
MASVIEVELVPLIDRKFLLADLALHSSLKRPAVRLLVAPLSTDLQECSP